MSSPAIVVDNLSKAYRIGTTDEVPDSLVGAIRDSVKAPWRNFQRLRRLNTYGNYEEANDLHWALRDVSFEVPEGEVLGVIGRNGAGKSTLLKILSRITEPTRGRATIRGRVSSLLEVGTGFHPELSGRENIYLNGTILGMRKREIDHKLDQIIDFSGVEKFLDTPIKRYSSGMKVRLAFAVAAHLEPEIMIIDEVLAVGDAEFQKKCLGKMNDVARSGRTVLFVSHQLPAVESLCTRILYLDRGAVCYEGGVSGGVGLYLEAARVGNGAGVADRKDRKGSGRARFASCEVLDNAGKSADHVPCGEGMGICAEISSIGDVHDIRVIFIVSTLRGQRMFRLAMEDYAISCRLTSEGCRVGCRIPCSNLMPGGYVVSLRLYSGSELIDELMDATQFSVYSQGQGSVRGLGTSHDLIYFDSEWTVAGAVIGK